MHAILYRLYVTYYNLYIATTLWFTTQINIVNRFHLNRARNRYFGDLTYKRFSGCPATQCYLFQLKTVTAVSNVVRNWVYSSFIHAKRRRLTTKLQYRYTQVPKMVSFGFSVVSYLTLCSLNWGGGYDIRLREFWGHLQASNIIHQQVWNGQCFRRKTLIEILNPTWNGISMKLYWIFVFCISSALLWQKQAFSPPFPRISISTRCIFI